jgi:hypothetical protein
MNRANHVNHANQKTFADEQAGRPSLSLVTESPATTGSSWRGGEEQTQELQLTFRELTLIYKSLQAVKTLGSLPRQDELLNDTVQLVDQALNTAA